MRSFSYHLNNLSDILCLFTFFLKFIIIILLCVNVVCMMKKNLKQHTSSITNMKVYKKFWIPIQIYDKIYTSTDPTDGSLSVKNRRVKIGALHITQQHKFYCHQARHRVIVMPAVNNKHKNNTIFVFATKKMESYQYSVHEREKVLSPFLLSIFPSILFSVFFSLKKRLYVVPTRFSFRFFIRLEEAVQQFWHTIHYLNLLPFTNKNNNSSTKEENGITMLTWR